MAHLNKSKPIPDRKKLCVWTLPEGSAPAVRVEVEGGRIIADRLMTIVCRTLRISERSKPCLALFKGLDPPINKFGSDEIIFLPCRIIISIQRWSFDPVIEARLIRTDPEALRLLSLQLSADMKAGRFKVPPEDLAKLAEFCDPQFPCHKQFVEYARSIPEYGTVVLQDVKLMSNLKLKTKTWKKESKIDISCGLKRMKLISERTELTIPWRKVRRWTQVSEHIHVSYEIFLMDEKAFTWIELETTQAPYLMQVTSELIGKMQQKTEPEFKQPDWVANPEQGPKLTWELFKTEFLGIRKVKKDPEPIFDTFEDEVISTDEEDGSDSEREDCARKVPRVGDDALKMGSISWKGGSRCSSRSAYAPSLSIRSSESSIRSRDKDDE